jgi:hypothetical protein
MLFNDAVSCSVYITMDACVREGGVIQELGQEDEHVCSLFIICLLQI